VHALVEFSALGQRCQQILCGVHILAPGLAPLTRLDVPCNVLVHVRPEVGLQQTLFCFGDALVAGQQRLAVLDDEFRQAVARRT
jgi:hypothetical protein